MKKYRRLLLCLLAINSMTVSLSNTLNANNTIDNNFKKRVISNIEQNKSNKKNYQIIEQMLKERNKELKDLYLQGDYIVKPEYLEWQVFFSGFYSERRKGDNTSENAKYSSDNKTPVDPAEPELPIDMNISISVPIRDVQENQEPLNITPIADLDITPSAIRVLPPGAIAIAGVTPLQFQPIYPSIPSVSVNKITPLAFNFPGSGNSDEEYIKENETVAPIAQQILIGQGSGGTLDAVSFSSNNSQDFNLSVHNVDATGLDNGNSHVQHPNGIQNFDWTGLNATHAVMKLVGGHIIDVDNMTMNLIGVGAKTDNYLMLIHTDAHDSGNETAVWNISGDTSINLSGQTVIFYGVQSHSNRKVGADMNNYGTIIADAFTSVTTTGGTTYSNLTPQKRIIFTTIDADPTDPTRYERYFTFNNESSGTIILNGTSDVLANYATPGVNQGGTIVTNDGDILLNGYNTIGILLNSFVNTLGDSKILFNKAIELRGDDSIGVQVTNSTINLDNSILNINIGTAGNEFNSTGNKAGNDENSVENALGLVLDSTTNPVSMTNYNIFLGDAAKSSTGIIVQNGDLTLKSSANSSLTGDGGIGNILLAAIGTDSKITTQTGANLNLMNGFGQVGIFASDGSTINHGGTLTATGDGTIGVISDDAVITNTGDLSITGGVYNSQGTVGIAVINSGSPASFTSTAGNININVSGIESTALFTDSGTIDITGGNIQTTEGAFNLYSKGSTGVIKLTNTSLTTGSRSLLFYSEDDGKFDLTNVNATITGGTDSTSRGTAFYYSGNNTPLNVSDLAAYFASTFGGTAGNLTLNMQAGSRLFIVDNIIMNLSTAATPLGNIPGGPQVVGNNYKTYMLYKGTLNIDQDVNLDSPTDPYNTLELATSHIENSGYAFNGTLANQVGMAQENGLDTSTPPVSLPRNQVTLINNGGTFNLSGETSVGIYASNGDVANQNGGQLNITGVNSAGIYAVNGTHAINDSTSSITIGVNGVGIYAEGYKQGVAQAFGDGTLDIINNGTITANTGINAIGIYLNNNSTGVNADTKVDLTGGTINMQNSMHGVGVYLNKGTLTDSGSTITVGQNGIALYIKDGEVNLNNTVINLNGDGALGIYFDGNTNFTGNGTINIDGKNVIIYNMISGGTISSNFSLGTVTPGSSYFFGSIIGDVAHYTGTANLVTNGSFILGKNSGIYLDNSTITADPGSTNTSAMVLNGQTGLPSGSSAYAGMTPDIDGENNGTITLENKSAAIYGRNGARLSNVKDIAVGDGSVGIMTSGTGSVAINSGNIVIGSGSEGMSLENGSKVENKASGTITSSASQALGIYTNGVTDPIINDGIISLTGNNSIGIFTVSTNPKIINNNNTIVVGDSSDPTNPSIGIVAIAYGDQITNNNITSGANSVGIYSLGGQITQNGILNIGDNGIGVYLNDGSLTIANTAALNLGTNDAVGVYATDSAISNAANMYVGDNNFGLKLINSTFNNTASSITLGNNSVFLYSTGSGTITNNSGTTITLNGSDNIAYYLENGTNFINDGIITGTAGTVNVAVYDSDGTITNNGTISLGDSRIVYKKDYANNDIVDANGDKIVDTDNSMFTVGMYGINSTLTNTGTISVGSGGVGIVAKSGTATNNGTITSTGAHSMGMYTETGTITNNNTISITGDNVIGMVGNGESSKVINNGTIQVSGKRAIGMYGLNKSEIINGGKIIANGDGAQGIVLGSGSTLNNTVSGEIIVNGINSGNYSVGSGETGDIPTIINSGVIKVSEKFTTDGIDVVIKVDPSTIKKPTESDIVNGGYDPSDINADYLISNAIKIEAPEFDITSPLKITGDFAQGTNSLKYKLEDVIIPNSGQGIEDVSVPTLSKSLTWKATSVVNGKGNLDIWMEKIPYDNFTNGLWYQNFGIALDNHYLNATGNALIIYDKIDLIETEPEFRHIMASLAGNVYANINQREDDISRVFENSLDLLQNSKNNTKENVKIDVIVGKGKNKEKTDGVNSYDYSSAGVLALREVERTYKHTFGYSLGYLHTSFEFDDDNSSEEWVDTIQLGVHNKYTSNNWKLKNNLTGKVSFHNIDRNIDWNTPNGRSEMNGTYETYSILSDNTLGREFEIGKKAGITPYIGLRAMYVIRPTFTEKGTEALKVDGNDAWSVKPRVGIELNASTPISKKSSWKLKGTLDLSYDYELADLNEREQAKLVAIEDNYHDLSKPKDEKGRFNTKASIGVEVEDRYGIFLTGEYIVNDHNQNDYRAGVSLKAVF